MKSKHRSHNPSNHKETEEDYFSGDNDSDQAHEQSEAEEVNDNEDKENEDGKENKVVKIKNVVRKPQPKLDANRLCGVRGLKCLPELFEKFKPKGDGQEFRDLDVIISKYEYWAHRLFPKMKFVDVVERLEKLGDKREVKHFLHCLRLGDATDENETVSINDPLTEDQERTVKLMNMMSDLPDSDEERELMSNVNSHKKTINSEDEDEIDIDEYLSSIAANRNSNTVAAANKKPTVEEEEDEDEIFNRLLSTNAIKNKLFNSHLNY